MRCCQGIPAALVTPTLKGLPFFGFPAQTPVQSPAELHLQPHYRAHMPLDAVLLKAQAGGDRFVTEKYQGQIARVFERWRACLVQSPQDTEPIETALASDFGGSSLAPIESRTVRPGRALQVYKNKFTPDAVLGPADFFQGLRSSLASFSEIITAEFQVISAEMKDSKAPTGEAGFLNTRLRYELVGRGRACHREQRVGHWDLEWAENSAGELRLKKWKALEETLSRAADPVFADITSQAFASNSSYSAQLLHGVDYWRTVLDGACGIDIYGHNGVSVGDIDGDGFDDLYVCQPAGLPNLLYRNRGDGTF